MTLHHISPPKRLASRRFNLLAAIAASAIGVAGCGGHGNADDPTVTVLSSRPDTVSGGDALIEVTAGAGGIPGLQVTANGSDVTSRFAFDAARGTYVGLVSGLRDGDNMIAVTTPSGRRTTLSVNNHPITGPIFSGPHQSPFICQTQDFVLPDGSKLGPPLDTNCSAKTVVQYVYWSSTAQAFKPVSPTAPLPADVSQTTTSTGATVNYIVRVETGTINRAIYQTAILHDPTVEAEPTATARSKGWNGRLVYGWGGGGRVSYRQGLAMGPLLNDTFLSKGFGVASSTMNGAGTEVNDVRSAEAASMVKERFIESYGVPLYTLGWGLSAATQNMFLIAQNYPGILDGMAPNYSFSDQATNLLQVTDCRLLKDYFDRAGSYTIEKKTAVAGWYSWGTCEPQPGTQGGFPWLGVENLWLHPVLGCNAVLPVNLRYDPVSNPTGARCTVVDNQVNLYGVDARGFARRPFDNVGVQYGLRAFKSGQISADEFLDLNEKIGGYDIDGAVVADRMQGDPLALEFAYRNGRVNQMVNVDQIAIIEYRPYRDAMPDQHDRVRSLNRPAFRGGSFD